MLIYDTLIYKKQFFYDSLRKAIKTYGGFTYVP